MFSQPPMAHDHYSYPHGGSYPSSIPPSEYLPFPNWQLNSRGEWCLTVRALSSTGFLSLTIHVIGVWRKYKLRPTWLHRVPTCTSRAVPGTSLLSTRSPRSNTLAPQASRPQSSSLNMALSEALCRPPTRSQNPRIPGPSTGNTRILQSCNISTEDFILYTQRGRPGVLLEAIQTRNRNLDHGDISIPWTDVNLMHISVRPSLLRRTALINYYNSGRDIHQVDIVSP